MRANAGDWRSGGFRVYQRLTLDEVTVRPACLRWRTISWPSPISWAGAAAGGGAQRQPSRERSRRPPIAADGRIVADIQTDTCDVAWLHLRDLVTIEFKARPWPQFG